MPLFRREPATSSAPAGAAANAAAGGTGASSRRGTATWIAPGTTIKGEVSGSTEIQVEGEIEGSVDVAALVVVGAGGSVVGPIHAKVVRVVGRVAGNVTADERVEVAPTGSVEGDLAAPGVMIAEGAFFRGRIEMKGDQNREPRRPGKTTAETPRAAADAGSK